MLLSRAVGLVVLVLAVATTGRADASDLMTDVVEPYLQVQTALVNDDLAPVRDGATRVARGARNLGAPGKAIADAATALAKAESLEGARVAFATLSDTLIAYADEVDIAIGDHVVAYCPMADASWVQKGNDVANPYYGAAMRTCGEVKRPLRR
jgi:hypothetical protein